MSNPPPLLAAKLDVPRLPSFHLPRPRLLRTLGTTTVTVITGAAGTGKTVLAAHWTRSGQAPGPVAWLRLDAEDNTPDVFWTFVLAALRAHLPRLDPVDRPLVVDRAFLGRLAGQLSERQKPVVLVLDRTDHHLRSRTIGRELDSLLRYAGDGLRLVLVGRGVRLLPLHHYQLADALTTLSTEDLALRPDETAELVALHGVRLDPSEVNRLHADTEGWITGVCLNARARRAAPADPGGARAAAHRAIGGFFRSEVLDALPGRVQELLLRNSLVRDVESGLADRLTARYTAAGVLDELVRADAFVRQIDLSTYRIHRLFREVLSEELSRRHPGLVRRLHQRAARWYAEHDRTADAVRHAALVRDWRYAAELVVPRGGVLAMLTSPRCEPSVATFAGLSAETVGAPVALVRAVAALTRYDFVTARGHARTARNLALAEADDVSAAARSTATSLEIVIGRLSGECDAAATADGEADVLAALLPSHYPADRNVRSFLVANLGAAHLWAGRHRTARVLLDQAAGDADPATSVGVHDALAQLALLDYADDLLGPAEAHAAASVTAAVRAGLPAAGQYGAASAALAGVALQRNDLPAVREHLARAITAAGSPHDPTTAVALALLRSRLSSGRGDGHRGLAALQVIRANAAGWHLPATVRSRLDLATAEGHLVLGELGVAEEYLRRIPAGAEQALGLARLALSRGDLRCAAGLLDDARTATNSPGALLRGALLRAEVAARGEQYDAACEALREALERARPDQQRRPFVLASAWIRPLLRGDSALAAEHAWLSCATDRSTSGPPSPTSAAAERLTNREVDVLRRLAQAQSTGDIAVDLHLSVNTVKSHLKSIYRKLGATGRSQAARRARELHLLDDSRDAG
ncbi:helix-turn-helix transcriptional regulator [Cryptosporangium minutisporangium]|uniref:LuxR family transcriptional regulator n=1 Tax=Cryptosporangium minutisporangium TaxID=113569 RepID=A0ABP6SX87_9ACTN